MKPTLKAIAFSLSILQVSAAFAAPPAKLPASKVPGNQFADSFGQLPPLPGAAGANSAAAIAALTGVSANRKPTIANAKLPVAELSREEAAPIRASAPTVAPALLSEFESLVKDSLGNALPFFGQDLFANRNPNGSQSIPAAADYVVGPGDELVVKAWGSLDIDYRATVDTDGTVFIPSVGTIAIAGTKFAEARRVLSAAIGKSYRNFNLSVALGQMRSSEVKVVGLVARPGPQQLSPYATVLDALAEAGGPASRGSWRQVSLVRQGKTTKIVDVYDLLLKGDRSTDLRVQPGDVIVVKPAAAQVAIAGAVTREAIFEMKAGESLGDLLGFAGGYAVTALPKQLRVERVNPTTRMREVIEVTGDQIGAFAIQDGDLVRVPRITGEFANAVTLRGAVADPMRLSWKQGFKVTDLITTRDQLIETSYWKNRNATIHQNATGGEEALRQNIKRSYDEINWDYAVVERLDRNTLQAQLIPFNLGKALDNDAKENLDLLPGDTVTVFSKTDVKVPMERQNRYVRIEGEVRQPGVYLATPADNLKSLVAKAGGLTDYAYLYGSEFKRESTKKKQQEKMKAVLDKLQMTISSAARGRAAEALTAEDARLNQAEAENDARLFERLKQMESSGRVVMELGPTAHGEAALPELSFEDGDVMTIPAKPATVGVAGSVFNENAFLFKPGKSVGDYVKQAGGPANPSASNLYYIARADGGVVPASRGDELYAGDTVLVMEEVGKKPLTRSLRDWTQIVYQLGLGVAGFALLK